MATLRRSKTFIYKRAVFMQQMGGQTLASVLKAALIRSPSALKRLNNPSGDEASFCFLNSTGNRISSKDSLQIFGCEFLSYVAGSDQSALEIHGDADEVPVTALVLDGSKEFLEGNLYFGVVGNHVIVMQSAALRVPDLEYHLNWFLVQHTHVLTGENRVELHDAVPGEADPKKLFADVKGLSIGASATLAPTRDQQEQSPKEKFKALRPAALKRGVLQLILDSLDSPTNIKAADLEDNRSLKVDLFLRWVEGGGDEEDAKDFLGKVAGQMRHIDDQLDYNVETKSGRINKKDFKLKLPFHAPWKDGRPEFDSLFPRMISWLVELKDTGKIKL